MISRVCRDCLTQRGGADLMERERIQQEFNRLVLGHWSSSDKDADRLIQDCIDIWVGDLEDCEPGQTSPAWCKLAQDYALYQIEKHYDQEG